MKLPHPLRTSGVLLATLVLAVPMSAPASALIAPTPGGAPSSAPVSARPPLARGTAVAAPTRRLAATQPRAAAAIAIGIPRLRIKQSMIRLHVQRNRSLTVPKRFSDIGWWSEGTRPGAQGAVIVAAHIKSRTEPGAFLNLRTMRRGDLVTVDRADGTTAVFQVRTKASYPRRNYPNGIVYRQNGKPSLHLITCDREFDPRIGHYVNNLVVAADFVSSHRTRRAR